MSIPHKGTLDPKNLKNPEKYEGDINKIIYRSSWEREAIMWCDSNPNVVAYASEELFFPYFNPLLERRARYFPDLWIKMSDGLQRVIEIKPKEQTVKPEEKNRKTKKYVAAVTTWLINKEKWKAAQQLCEKSNLQFEIWTEDTLKEMGLLKVQGNPVISERAGRPKLKPLVKKPRSKRERPKRKS